MTPAFNTIGLGLLTAVMAIASAWALQRSSRLVREKEDLLKRVAALETGHAKTTAEVMPITAAFQAILIKQLTHFHTPRMDELMVKLGPPSTLTEAEDKELATALEERSRDMDGLISEYERDCAKLLPFMPKMVKHEFELLEKARVAVQTVAIVTLPDDKTIKPESDKVAVD